MEIQPHSKDFRYTSVVYSKFLVNVLGVGVYVCVRVHVAVCVLNAYSH